MADEKPYAVSDSGPPLPDPLSDTVAMGSPLVSSTGYEDPGSESSGRLPTLKPGERIGGCVVSRFIAWGGMGEVYEGRHETLDRRVAIKLIREKYADDPKYRERFSREAKVAAQFTEPHIAIVFDAGEHGRQLYVVFEFIEGEDVGRKIRRMGQLPPMDALRIARDVALGLEAAHAKGIIHRDVKPSNVMVTRQNTAKLTDFGLVRIMHAQDKAELESIIGTPQYMSPEQWQSQKLDGRADLYSLGVTLYEMLCGQLPVRGQSLNDIYAQALAHQLIPLRDKHPGLEPEIYALVDSALLPVPERIESAREFIRRIDRILFAQSVNLKDSIAASLPISGMEPAERASFGPLASPPRRQQSWTPVWVVLLLLASIGFFIFSLTGAPQPSQGTALASLPPIRLTWCVHGRRTNAAGASMPLDLLQDKALIASGDQFAIRITPEQDCCLYVVWLKANGQATVLFPSGDPKGAHVGAHRELVLPGAERFLGIEPGAGSETLYVAASYEPLEPLCRLLRHAAQRVPATVAEWVKAFEAASQAPVPKGFSLEAPQGDATGRQLVKVAQPDGTALERTVQFFTGAAGVTQKLILRRQQ